MPHLRPHLLAQPEPLLQLQLQPRLQLLPPLPLKWLKPCRLPWQPQDRWIKCLPALEPMADSTRRSFAALPNQRG